MGWICITEACEGHIVNGIWDGVGIAYFSISDEVTILHDTMFNYLMSIGADAYMFGLFMLIISLVVAIIVSIKLVVMKSVIR